MVIFKTADVGDIFFIFIRNSKRRLIEHSCSLVFFSWLFDHVTYLKLGKNKSLQSWENTQNVNYFHSNSFWVVILWICSDLQTVISLLQGVPYLSKIYYYILRFFDCLAHPNLSETFATYLLPKLLKSFLALKLLSKGLFYMSRSLY